MKQRIAVIGGVAAGPAAAAEAKRTDPGAEVVLFEQGPRISYGACEMPYYLAGWIDEAETLVVLSADEYERSRGVAVKTGHQVTAIYPRRCRVEVEHEGRREEVRFDKIILAVGARARLPDVDGLDAPNVRPLRRLDDAIALRRLLDAGNVHHAVLLGGGYIGVEVAEALRARGVRVTLLEPGPGVLHRTLGPELRAIVGATMRREGVVVRREKAVGLERSPGGAAHAIRTDQGELIGCQLVVVTMGVVPNTDLAEAAGLKVGETGALAVDDQMRTNLPNVWACGDCIEVERVVDKKKIHLPLSPVAFRSAHVAGANAARQGRGGPARFPGVCAAAAVQVFGLEVASVGLRLDEALEGGFDAVGVTRKHWSRVKIYPGSKPIHVHYVVERRTGRLLGAELVGEEGAAHRADVLVPLIREGWTLDALLDLDLIYTPPLAPAHDPLLVAAHAAKKKLEASA